MINPEINKSILTNKYIPYSAKLLFREISKQFNQDYICDKPVEHFIDELNISERRINYLLNRLKNEGIINIISQSDDEQIVSLTQKYIDL